MAKAKTKPQTESQPEKAAAKPSYPLYFTNPQPIDGERHATAGLRKINDFSFARKSNSIPVSIYEFVVSARSYPIVFTNETTPMPVVVVGMRDSNCFINEKNEWEPFHHVPHYVQKYPFALLEVKGTDQFVLCVDEGAEGYQSEKAERRFYQGKEPTELCQKAMDLCGQFHTYYQASQGLGEALKKHGLLEPREMTAKLASGEEVRLSGFQTVSEEKWNQLPLDQFDEFRCKGWAALVYLVLASQSNWQFLAMREK